jgi:murein L,D-transpeptidase YcbB/YkuD
LDKGVPVFITSLTASAVDGKVAFADDVYGYDQPVQAAAATSPASPSMETTAASSPAPSL